MIQSKAVGSAAAPAAVRRAPRRTLYPKDKLSGGAPGAGMPTARAPLAAPEAGALPDSDPGRNNSVRRGRRRNVLPKFSSGLYEWDRRETRPSLFGFVVGCGARVAASSGAGATGRAGL